MVQVGVIYGTTDTTTFRFAVSGDVKRNSYAQIEHPEGRLLALVTDVSSYSDITFEDAKKISSGIQIKKEGRLSAVASVIGYRDKRSVLQTPRTPSKPGSPVYTAEEGLIRDVLGLSKNGIYLGLLRWHNNIPVCLDPKSLTEKHISILAKTGSGKSYLVGVLIEELIKHEIPVIVIDPHSEYSSLIHPNLDEKEIETMKKFRVKPKGYAEHIAIYSPDTKTNPNARALIFSDINMTPEQIFELISMKNPVHRSILRRVINELKPRKAYYTLNDIKEAIREDSNNAKWGVVNSLESLLSTHLFSESGMSPSDLVKDGQATIINLRGAGPETQEIIVSMITRSLFNMRKLRKIPKTMIVVEEAHNFCPQSGNAKSSSILRTIASEGRKFGLGMAVVSQRPAIVDKNILSQCGLQIILKITNPNDLKAIINSFEGLSSSAFDEIQRLPVGVGIVVGGNISMPVLTDIRVRETRHGAEEVIEPSFETKVKIEEPVEKIEEIIIKETKPKEEKKQKKRKGLFAKYFMEKDE